MMVLRTSETTDRATVRSHPCQKALRYFHNTSQFRVVEASKAQETSENTANKKPIVAIFAQRGDGVRGRSIKLTSKLFTLPLKMMSRVRVRLARSPPGIFARAAQPGSLILIPNGRSQDGYSSADPFVISPVMGTKRTSSIFSLEIWPFFFLSRTSCWIPPASPTGMTRRPPSLSWEISGSGT